MAENKENDAPKNPEIIGSFLLAVQGVRFPNGETSINIRTKNKSLPFEVVLMQIKSWLRNRENKYYEVFDKNFDNLF